MQWRSISECRKPFVISHSMPISPCVLITRSSRPYVISLFACHAVARFLKSSVRGWLSCPEPIYCGDVCYGALFGSAVDDLVPMKPFLYSSFFGLNRSAQNRVIDLPLPLFLLSFPSPNRRRDAARTPVT